MPGRTVNRGKSYVAVSAALLPILTIRDPSTATTALRSTPPLPSRTAPARIVMGCWAAAGAAAPTSPATTGAMRINQVRIGPPAYLPAYLSERGHCGPGGTQRGP